MKKLFKALAFTPTTDRLQVARFLFYLLIGMGVIDAFLEARAGNWPVVAVAIAGTILAPATLLAARLFRAPFLPLYVALGFMVLIFQVGAFTQHHRPGNFVWYSIYPIVWFNLAGLRAGTVLSLLGMVSWIAGWFAYPFISEHPRVAGDVFAQALAAYATTAIFAFIYEHTRARQEEALKESAQRDFLTGALNRRGFIELANILLDEARRFGQPCSVALIDLDHFKAVNDLHGHEAGDKLLRDVVVLAKKHLRQVDQLGRWGGEEFVVLLPHTDLAGAYVWADRVRQAIAAHNTAHRQPVTASFGIATRMANDNLDDIVRRADEALYQAKEGGRNRVAPRRGAVALEPLPA